MLSFYDVTMVTVWHWIYKRECRMEFIRWFNLKNFIAEGTFN